MVTKQQFVIISLLWRSIRLAVLVIASLSFNACSKDSGGLSTGKFAEISLLPIDTVHIAIDSTTSNVSPLFNYIEWDGKRFLILFNSALRRLQCYDLDKLNESFVIKLESEGPNSVPDIGGFIFHRPDSIDLKSVV